MGKPSSDLVGLRVPFWSSSFSFADGFGASAACSPQVSHVTRCTSAALPEANRRRGGRSESEWPTTLLLFYLYRLRSRSVGWMPAFSTLPTVPTCVVSVKLNGLLTIMIGGLRGLGFETVCHVSISEKLNSAP
jgi:hypothetical protein